MLDPGSVDGSGGMEVRAGLFVTAIKLFFFWVVVAMSAIGGVKTGKSLQLEV